MELAAVKHRGAALSGQNMPHLRLTALAAALVLWAPLSFAFAQEPPPDATALAKQTQNPVGDLVSLPFQFNFNSGGDLEDQTLFNLNFQPVIPIKLNPRWSLIARTIVPINSVPVGVDARSSGVGDVQQQLYITPARPGKIIWGIGPMFSLPTATADASRTGSWALGPGAVILAMHGSLVYGGLVQQFWTMADTGGDPEINQFVLQPFFNYNFGQPVDAASHDCQLALPDEEVGIRRRNGVVGILLVFWFILGQAPPARDCLAG
jgi:hypothetical protein